MFSAYQFILGFAVCINTLLIVVLYRSKQKNTTIASLILLLIQVSIWFTPKLLTNAFHIEGHLFETLSRISALGYIFVPVTFLVFAVSYGMYYEVFHKFYFWLLLLLPPVFFLYLSWTSDLVGVHDAERIISYPWGYETPTGDLWPYYMFWYDTSMLIGISILVYNYHRLVDQIRKKQTLTIIFAVIFPLITATLTTGILPLFNIFVFPVGLVLAIAMTIIGVTVIYRYGWFTVTPLSILSSINHVIITVDNQGHVIQMNPYSERMLQVKHPHVIGKPLEKLLIVQDTQKRKRRLFSQFLNPVISRGKSMMLDTYSILNRKNQLFATTGSITPIFSDKGVVGANIFLRDATQEKAREQQKADYFSMLSHELKTPMTSIKAYSELLLAKLPAHATRSRDIAMKINSHIDGLTRRINDFLELSRLTSGKFKLDREVVEVDDFVQGVVENMKVTYKKRKIFLIGQTRSLMFADKIRVEQVLINFITNAAKFSRSDKKIIVSLRLENNKIVVGVQDFGEGIHPKYQKRIFDRFFQVDDYRQGKSGLGMGLFIASTIVKAHNGKIWVESEPGKGSIFCFSLPVNT